jgi:hypothetical protein
MILLLLVAPARAGGDDPTCHETATNPAWDPTNPIMADILTDAERVEFFSKCKGTSDVALYCTHLTKTIRKKDPGANAVIKYFVADKGPCKDKDSVQAYCKLWTTYDGLKILIDEPEGYPDPADPGFDMPSRIVDRSARLCGMTREALLAKFCTAAGASRSQRDWDLAVQACPKEGKEIHMRNCVGKLNEFRQAATPKQCEDYYQSIAKKF